MLREYWESLPPERCPHTLALLDVLFEGGPDERFEFGLDVIVRGLASLGAGASAAAVPDEPAESG